MNRLLQSLRKNHFFRFLLVGGVGTVLNLLAFYVLSDKLGVNHNIASVAAFALAVTQNYVFNELWGFSSGGARELRWKRYGLYVSGNILGLSVNLIILNALLAFFSWRLKTIPQAFGIGSATVLNFLWARHIVFLRRKAGHAEGLD